MNPQGNASSKLFFQGLNLLLSDAPDSLQQLEALVNSLPPPVITKPTPGLPFKKQFFRLTNTGATQFSTIPQSTPMTSILIDPANGTTRAQPATRIVPKIEPAQATKKRPPPTEQTTKTTKLQSPTPPSKKQKTSPTPSGASPSLAK